MAFLGLLVVASLFAADEDDLKPVGFDTDPATGIFYDCASITAPSNPSQEQAAAARQKCIDTKWCIWNIVGTGGTCTNDLCLKYLGDSDADYTHCTSLPITGGCTVKYLVDGVNCTSGNFEKVQTSRFCRATDNAYIVKDYIDDCFYTDLKSIGQGRDGNRLCTGATCGNKTSSAGGYCTVTGTDCSIFDKDTDDYCACLGPNNCDLYPHCFKNTSSTCIFDQCSLLTPDSQVQGAICYFQSGIPSTNCKVRPQNTYDESSNSLVKNWVCVNTNKIHPNECYFAVKSTTTPGNIKSGSCGGSTGVSCDYCDKVTYDEAVCTNAFILNNDEGAGVTPGGSNNYEWSTDKNCQLVDIAAGYIGATQGKYCTDGDRTVPSPDGGSLVRVPSVLAFAFILLAVIVL